MSQRPRIVLALTAATAVLSLLSLTPAGLAQLEIAEIAQPPVVNSDDFGFAVDIDGDRLAIGAPQDEANGMNEGAVFVYLRDRAGTLHDPSDDTWTLQAKVLGAPKEPTWPHPEFGSSVALDGDRLLVGAPWAHSSVAYQPGAAYLFHFDGASWLLEDVLIAADGADGDQFGVEVALSGGHAFVSATWDDDLADRSGAAYVFRNDGGSWVEQDKLHGDPLAGDASFFGWSLAVEDGQALIGAVNEDSPTGTSAGAVHAFELDDAGTHHPGDDAWTPVGKLQPADASQSQFFGSGLAIDGARALVGASGDGEVGPGFGAAYVFERIAGAWTEQAKLAPAPAAVGELSFGASVALHGDTAVISSRTYDPLALAQDGSVHVFREAGGSWTPAGTASPDSGSGPSPLIFGDSLQVAFDGEVAVAGTRNELPFVVPLNNGSTWAFAVEQAPWSWLGHELAGAEAAPTLFGAGTLVAGTPVTLSVHDGPSNAPTLLFLGGSVLNLPFKGGLLVPQPDRVSLTALDADGSLALASSWPAGFVSGLTLYLQAWIADPSGPAGFTATNALAVTTP